MKKRKKLKKIVKIVKKGILITTSMAVMGGYSYEFGDEILYATEEERALEEELGIPINLSWSYRGEERSERIALLDESISQARENWDFFPQQFAEVNFISIGEINSKGHIGSYHPLLGLLRANCTSSGSYCLEDDDLVHELNHAWYFSLSNEEKGEFDQRWDEIVGREYACSSLIDYIHGELFSDYNCFPENSCREIRRELGATSCHGAKISFEDMAEVANLVYLLNNPHYFLPYFPNQDSSFRELESNLERQMAAWIQIDSETIPLIIPKVELLCEYGAFSERERDHALEELRGYSRDDHP